MSGELRIKVFPKFGIERFEFIAGREFEARRLVSTLIHRISETNRMNRDEEIVAKFHHDDLKFFVHVHVHEHSCSSR